MFTYLYVINKNNFMLIIYIQAALMAIILGNIGNLITNYLITKIK